MAIKNRIRPCLIKGIHWGIIYTLVLTSSFWLSSLHADVNNINISALELLEDPSHRLSIADILTANYLQKFKQS